MRNIGTFTRTLCCLLTCFASLPVQAMRAGATSTEALCSAAAKGDDSQVRHLLHAGVAIDAQGEYGPALVYAAEQGHLSTVMLLLRAGAHLHACGKESELFRGTYNRALWEAADHGHTAVVRYLLDKTLLDKRVDKNARDDNGYNALLAAAAGQRWQTVRVLMEYGADPNYQTRHYQNSALMLACVYGNQDTVELLLRHGADVSLEDKSGHTALWLARQYNYSAIVRRLRKAGSKR